MIADLRVASRQIKNLLPESDSSESEMFEDFALISWATICEPGDGFAGLLVSKLGAAKALECELKQISAGALHQLLLDAGSDFDELGELPKFAHSLVEGRQRWHGRLLLQNVLKAIESITAVGGAVITRRNTQWPEQLGDLGNSEPFALWLRGTTEALGLAARSAAIVGCRGASSYGEYVTADLVQALVADDYSVVSGGAYGIDAMAHRATLALEGNAISVMAGGLNTFYPSGNKQLLESVAKQGVVVSEVPPGTSPTKWRFLQRNRLIAGLAQSVIVVEANWRSGSMNTVSHGETLGRDIFAVPGAVTSPTSAGTNQLIGEQRAQLVIDGKDLVSKLKTGMGFEPHVLPGLGALETRALDAIGFGSAELAEICYSAGLTRDEARIALGSLELDGLVARRNNAWQRKQTTV